MKPFLVFASHHPLHFFFTSCVNIPHGCYKYLLDLFHNLYNFLCPLCIYFTVCTYLLYLCVPNLYNVFTPCVNVAVCFTPNTNTLAYVSPACVITVAARVCTFIFLMLVILNSLKYIYIFFHTSN